MEFENLLTLIDKVASTDLTDFSFDNGEVEISMKRKRQDVFVTAAAESVNQTQAPIQAAAVGTPQSDESESLPAGNILKAPLVGTFYNSASPENPPYVKVGDTVKKGQILGIIEAMKLMNEIESEFDGVIETILIENEQMVEYGQPLFVIK